jgi:hypothetical protein
MPFEIQSEAELPKLDERAGNHKNEAGNGGPEPFVWIGGTELSAMNVQPPKMIVEKILPAGALTVICAKSKSGKTTLVAELCQAICMGRPALGRYPVTQGPVLYWLADDSNVARFARAWREIAGDVPVRDFNLCVARQPLYPNGLINLEEAVKQFHPVFIAVDSYTEVRSPVGPKTDFVKAEYQDMRRLSEFAASSSAATALIHHSSKAIRLDPFDAMAGSFALGAGADARIVLEKLDATQRLVRIDGRDLDEFQFVYARNASRRLTHVIDGDIAKDWQRINMLASKPGKSSFTTQESAEVFGLSDRQMRRVLSGWEQLGAVIETTRGNYTFENSVIEAVAKCRKGYGGAECQICP